MQVRSGRTTPCYGTEERIAVTTCGQFHCTTLIHVVPHEALLTQHHALNPAVKERNRYVFVDPEHTIPSLPECIVMNEVKS